MTEAILSKSMLQIIDSIDITTLVKLQFISSTNRFVIKFLEEFDKENFINSFLVYGIQCHDWDRSFKSYRRYKRAGLVPVDPYSESYFAVSVLAYYRNATIVAYTKMPKNFIIAFRRLGYQQLIYAEGDAYLFKSIITNQKFALLGTDIRYITDERVMKTHNFKDAIISFQKKLGIRYSCSVRIIENVGKFDNKTNCMYILTYNIKEVDKINNFCYSNGIDCYRLSEISSDIELDLGFSVCWDEYWLTVIIMRMKIPSRSINDNIGVIALIYVKKVLSYMGGFVFDNFPNTVTLRFDAVKSFADRMGFKYYESKSNLLHGSIEINVEDSEIKDEKEIKHLQVSGHLYSLLISSHYYVIDIMRYFSQIELNLIEVSGESSSDLKYLKKLRARGELIHEEYKGNLGRLWHSYYEYVISIDIYYNLCDFLNLKPNELLVELVRVAIDELGMKYPVLRSNSFGVMDYLGSIQKN